MEKLGAGSRPEGVQALAEAALELIGFSMAAGHAVGPSARVSDTPGLSQMFDL